jgi:microcystin-dependent protein
MSFAFAPKGWALCNGQLLPINQNQALFALLGTTFGGNGQTNFALPDFRARVPIHVGSGHTNGEKGGEQAHTLSIAEMPTHVHQVMASTADASTDVPANTEVLAKAGLDIYHSATNLVAMEPGVVGNVGGSQAHLNMQPFLTISFCIALQGIFPSPN